MASGGGGSRARADYDYLIKLLLIGDSGTKAHALFFTCWGCIVVLRDIGK